MTMQALVRAGLAAGDKLMPAGPSNADGHFEDVETVNLHDQWLRDNHSNWCHQGELPVVNDRVAADGIHAIAARLQSQGKAWGIKDPRACLFLSQWFANLESLGGLFTYRHFASCFESLQRRHADDLLLTPQDNSDSFALFNDPTLALKSWLAYNKNIIAQMNRTPERCLLVSQSALVSGFPLVQTVNQIFSMNLDVSADLRIDETRVANRKSIELPPCTDELKHELLSVWEELQSLSVGPAQHTPELVWQHESANVISMCSSAADVTAKGAVEQLSLRWDRVGVPACERLNFEMPTLTMPDEPSASEQPVTEFDLADLNETDFSKRALVTNVLSGIALLSDKQAFLELGIAKLPSCPFLHGLLGACLYNQQKWEASIAHLNRAKELGSKEVSVYLHTALWHRQKGNVSEARRYLQIVINERRNADHLINLIQLNNQDRSLEEAKRLAMLGYSWFAKDERFVLLYADVMVQMGRHSEAIDWLHDNDSGSSSVAIARKLYEIYNGMRDKEKQNIYNTEMHRRILRGNEHYRQCVTSLLVALDNDYARRALLGFWTRSLDRMLSDSEAMRGIDHVGLQRSA